MKKGNGIHIENTYVSLNENMYSIVNKRNNTKEELVLLNYALAEELGISSTFLKSEDGVNFLTGNTDSYGPLYAQAYAGHQFGHFTVLGDGRAMLLGEHVTKEGKRVDLQLKGSGRTPYSRGGDGKATLYSMLREYLISESIHFLGIPTTRSLAVTNTNEKIKRQKIESGGLLCRVASSHIRVGTFEYAKANGGIEAVKELADYTINRHYSELNESANKYENFLHEVIKRQASLVAKWQSIGFVHGVLNTDNVSISGETIDYGPCAFMDIYKKSTVFSSIDTNGRYSYQNQPYITSWNLARFAETMLELYSDSEEESVEIANNQLKKYGDYFKSYNLEYMANKLGIQNPTEEDDALIEELLSIMEKSKADFTNTFRLLTINAFTELPFYNTKEWTVWFQKWTRALGYRRMSLANRTSLMKKSNPVIIPRNHIVEEALTTAANDNDYTLFNTLLEKMKNPYGYNVLHKEELLNPSDNHDDYMTYCGT